MLLLSFILMLFAYMSKVIYNQKLRLDYAKAVYHATEDQLKGVSHVLSQKENELGQQQTKVVALKGDKETLQLILDNQSSLFARQLQQLKIDLKDLKSVTNLRVTTSGQFVTITKDTIIKKVVGRKAGDTLTQEKVLEKLRLIDYKEPQGWFTMKGSIRGDTMKFNPVFYEEYDVAIHEERKPRKHWLDLFPGKQTVGTVLSKNPYTKTNSVKVMVQEKEKRKLFGIF